MWFYALPTVQHTSFPGLNRQFSGWANLRACASLKKMEENICEVVAEYEKRLQGMLFFLSHRMDVPPFSDCATWSSGCGPCPSLASLTSGKNAQLLSAKASLPLRTLPPTWITNISIADYSCVCSHLGATIRQSIPDLYYGNHTMFEVISFLQQHCAITR